MDVTVSNSSPAQPNKLQQFFRSNRLSVYTILGVFLGLLLGHIAKAVIWPTGPIDAQLLRYLSLPGTIYVRLFLILIVPLLVTSLSTSFLSETSDDETNQSETKANNEHCDPNKLNARKLILLTFIFFCSFSTFVAFFGSSLIMILKPGVGSSLDIIKNNISVIEKKRATISQDHYQVDSLYNILMSIFPDNIITPLFMIHYTKTEIIWPQNESLIVDSEFVPKLKSHTSHSFKSNMLGVCVISLTLGIILQKLGPNKTKVIRQLLRESDAIVKKLMQMLVKIMPFGMFFWMLTEAMKMHSMGEVAGRLVYFYAIIVSAFIFLWLVFYPLIYFFCTRENPYLLYPKILPAILVAFGSTSSAITLPVTLRCMEQKAGLAKQISNTVLPLGMTVHMNGPAMYYPMVAVFVAQMKSVPVDFFSLCILCLFSIVMSMGFPPSPSGGSVIVNHIAFASVLGIENPEDILAYILAFEWILSRIRTPTNIVGDCFVSKCVERLMKAN